LQSFPFSYNVHHLSYNVHHLSFLFLLLFWYALLSILLFPATITTPHASCFYLSAPNIQTTLSIFLNGMDPIIHIQTHSLYPTFVRKNAKIGLWSHTVMTLQRLKIQYRAAETFVDPRHTSTCVSNDKSKNCLALSYEQRGFSARSLIRIENRKTHK
jgi:hypothetical protein